MTKNDFADQLGRLVAFKTLPGNETENAKALDYIQTLIESRVKVNRIKNGQAEVLMAATVSLESPKYCYMVHMDVVSGREDQFEMKLDGDKAVGRGTCDMKFSLPIGVALLNEAMERKIDFCVMVTTDEEIGGFNGAKKVADSGFSPAVFIVPDGGENLNFVDKAKGVCQLKITAKGVPAHASRPWLGKNAIDILVKIGNELLEMYGKNSEQENWDTTINLGMIDGGVSTNQVCPEAEMKVDFRYPETDSIENIISVVEGVAKKVGGEVEIAKISTGLPTFTDVSNEEVIKYLRVMSEEFGREIKVQRTYGASDARHFAHLKSPVLMHKPLGGEIHSDDEWVSVSSTMKFYEGMRKYLDLV